MKIEIAKDDDGNVKNIKVKLKNGSVFHLQEKSGMLAIITPQYRADGFNIKPSAPNAFYVEVKE